MGYKRPFVHLLTHIFLPTIPNYNRLPVSVRNGRLILHRPQPQKMTTLTAEAITDGAGTLLQAASVQNRAQVLAGWEVVMGVGRPFCKTAVKQQMIKKLLAYCHLDTLAMVEIHDAWRSLQIDTGYFPMIYSTHE